MRLCEFCQIQMLIGAKRRIYEGKTNMEKDQQKKIAESLGLSEKDVSEFKEYKPFFKLSEIEVQDFEIKSKIPYEVKITDKKTQEVRRFMAVDAVMDGDSFVYALPLSSKTLSMGFINILQRHKMDLTGVKISIKRSVIEYGKWGENNCYRVQEKQ